MTKKTIGDFLESNNMTIKELAASNHLSIGDLCDLMNRDYDQNDPRFMGPVQLRVYSTAKGLGKATVCEQLKANMVTNPETIGLPKDNSYFKGMPEAIEAIDQAYPLIDHEVVHMTTKGMEEAIDRTYPILHEVVHEMSSSRTR